MRLSFCCICVHLSVHSVNSTPTCLSSTKTTRPRLVSEHRRKKLKNVTGRPFLVYRDPRIMWWQQIEKHLHLVCWLELPCLETWDARSTSTPLSASHRSEALRLGQRAINLLKCHFQREMDCRGGREERRDREVEGKISEDKQPA